MVRFSGALLTRQAGALLRQVTSAAIIRRFGRPLESTGARLNCGRVIACRSTGR